MEGSSSRWNSFYVNDDNHVARAFIVSKNTICSVDAYAPFGPIFTFGVQNAVISNNKISGRGPAAMYLGVFGEPSSNLMVKANNVENWETTDDQYGFPAIAPIRLGSGTSGYTVLGGDCSVNVFDEGVDNTLVGVNNVPGNSLGFDISNAMKKIRDFRK